MGLQLNPQDSLDSQTSTSSSEASTSSSTSTLSIASSCAHSRGPHKCLAILHGQGQGQGQQGLHVTALALTGDALYAGSNRGEIRAWDHPDMREGTKFGFGEAAVKCLVVVGDRVVSAHQDHKIRVWRRSASQPQEHRLVSTLPSVRDYIANFLPAKNYIQVRRHHKSLWINHNDSISCLALGNGVLYSGSWDKSVKVWRLRDFKCLESLTHHIDAVNALAVDKLHDVLYTGSGDTTIKVLQRHTPTHTLPKTKPHHTLVATLESKSPVNALALSPDSSLLYAAQSDKTITVWRRNPEGHDLCVVEVLRGHRLAVLCLATLGNLLVSGSADKSIRVWRRSHDGAGITHSCGCVMVGHRGPVKSLACGISEGAMGAVVYSGGMDGDVRAWWVPEDETEVFSSEEDDGERHV